MQSYIETFTEAYIESALWTGQDWRAMNEGGEDNPYHLDGNYGPGDLTADALRIIREDCGVFVRHNWALLHDLDAGQCGHDFNLTRNGHGAGFWDRELGNRGITLTNACHTWGEFALDSDGNGAVEAI